MINSSKNSILHVTFALLRQSGIRINRQTLGSRLKEHPEYPGLLSIIDTVSSFNINPLVYDIDKSSYEPSDFAFPFIAHLNNGSGHFILVQKINRGFVEFSDNEFKKGKTVSEADFLSKWSGIAFRVESTLTSGEPNYFEHKIRFLLNDLKQPALFLALAFWIFLSLSANSFSGIFIASLVIKLAGLLFSILLLVQSNNQNSILVQKLCALSGKKTCDSVLNSDASKITTWLSWSEVGFVYFAGASLSLLVSPIVMSALSWLSLLALPYVAYSIYHQHKQRAWCFLCLGVQSVLFLDAALSLNFGHFNPSEPLLALLIPFSGFIIVACAWGTVKKLTTDSSKLAKVNQAFIKFKYNTKLFRTALMSQPSYAIGPDLMALELGNKNAKTKITLVSSPFCKPCSEVHAVLDKLIHDRHDISLNIIFATSDNPHDEKNIVAGHLTSLSKTSDEQTLFTALHDWYSQPVKDFATWSERYPANSGEEEEAVLGKQNQWCAMVGVEFTPTLFVNGYKLPEPYQPSDLGYLLN